MSNALPTTTQADINRQQHDGFCIAGIIETGDTDTRRPCSWCKSQEDKWAAFDALSDYAKARVDKLMKDRGQMLHAGSTAEEIARAIRIYRSNW